jgi:hypothetical protein
MNFLQIYSYATYAEDKSDNSPCHSSGTDSYSNSSAAASCEVPGMSSSTAGSDPLASFAARYAFFQIIMLCPFSFSLICTFTSVGITFGNSSPSPLDVLGVQGSLTGVEVVVSLTDAEVPLDD